jgi:hypothetical protein
LAVTPIITAAALVVLIAVEAVPRVYLGTAVAASQIVVQEILARMVDPAAALVGVSGRAVIPRYKVLAAQ